MSDSSIISRQEYFVHLHFLDDNKWLLITGELLLYIFSWSLQRDYPYLFIISFLQSFPPFRNYYIDGIRSKNCIARRRIIEWPSAVATSSFKYSIESYWSTAILKISWTFSFSTLYYKIRKKENIVLFQILTWFCLNYLL